MMLGRHWSRFCAALSHRNSSTEFSIVLEFPSSPTASRDGYKASIPHSLHCQFQELFLECTRYHLRGVQRLKIYGCTHPESSSLVKKDVTAPRVCARPQWLTFPDEWCHLAQELQRQNRHIEAWGLWNVVHQTPTFMLHEALDVLSYKRLRFASNLGTALCYLHYLEPTQSLTNVQVTKIRDLAEASIHAARKRRVTDTDRARVLSLKCRLRRLECLWRSREYVGYSLMRRMELDLARAERYDRFDCMVVDERWRLRWFRSRIDVDCRIKVKTQLAGEGSSMMQVAPQCPRWTNRLV